MPDDKTKRGPADAKRVSMQPHEIRYVAEKLGCTQKLVKEVVADLKSTARTKIEPEVRRRMKAAKANG